jgi:hypothetical protein
MPAKRSQYNILPHNLGNAALMLQNFHINSHYGRLGEHPPRGRWEDYVENFQYNQALGFEESKEGDPYLKKTRPEAIVISL